MRGWGSHRSARRDIRCQVTVVRWLRRRSAPSQCHTAWRRKARSASPLSGSLGLAPEATSATERAPRVTLANAASGGQLGSGWPPSRSRRARLRAPREGGRLCAAFRYAGAENAWSGSATAHNRKQHIEARARTFTTAYVEDRQSRVIRHDRCPAPLARAKRCLKSTSAETLVAHPLRSPRKRRSPRAPRPRLLPSSGRQARCRLALTGPSYSARIGLWESRLSPRSPGYGLR